MSGVRIVAVGEAFVAMEAMIGWVSALTLMITALQLLIRIPCLRTIHAGAVIPIGSGVHLTTMLVALAQLIVAARKPMIRLSINPTLVVIAWGRSTDKVV